MAKPRALRGAVTALLTQDSALIVLLLPAHASRSARCASTSLLPADSCRSIAVSHNAIRLQ